MTIKKENVQTILDNYKKLPFQKKEAVFNALSEKIEKAKNDGATDKTLRIEKSLTRVLVKNWDNSSTTAINKVLRSIPKNEKRFTQKQADKVLASLTKSYNGIENKTKKRVEDDMEDIYKIEKKDYGKQFKLDSSSGKEKLFFKGLQLDEDGNVVDDYYEVNSFDRSRMKTTMIPVTKKHSEIVPIFKAVEFGVVDTEAYENLARLENTAIGDHFPKTLKPRVSKAIQVGVLDAGLNNADAAAYLEQELTKICGGNVAGATPASIAQGQASRTAYFEMVTATNTTYAKNFAHINLSSEAGITRLIFQAILDRQTSQVCNQMHGRVFTIEQALEHQEKVLGAENVEALKDIAPFKRDLSEFKLKEGKKLTDPKTSAALAKAGVLVPPLHGRCRSELQPE